MSIPLVRSERPGRRRRVAGPAGPQGLLHRHLDLHRLQGLRGGLQGVERASPRTASTCSAPPTTTPARSARAPGGTSRSSSSPSRSVASSSGVGPPARRPRHAVLRPARRADGGVGSTDTARVERNGSASTMVGERPDFRWLMSSDVCKHCTHAACLDVCPTGSLFRTEFGTVVVQDDICNGCGYCVPACPFGVIERRSGRRDAPRTSASPRSARSATTGIGAGQTPACAQACPTQSIQFGDLDELRERGRARVGAAARAGRHRGAAVRRRPRRRRRRRRRDVPAARRARGLRPAAGPGRHHPRPAAHVAPRGPGCGTLLVGAVAVFVGSGS